MEVSIVICCYNSAERIRSTLEHIKEQQLSGGGIFQVVLVDNNCSDQTVQVAQEVWGQCEFELVILKETTPGPEAARRCGINYSQSKYVLCCDDDNWLDANYIVQAYAFMQTRPEYAAVGGWGEVVSDSDVEIPDWFEQYQTKYACGHLSPVGDVNNLVTAGLFLRKEAWDQLRGHSFRPVLAGRKGSGLQTGEDFELTMALRLAGWKLHYSHDLHFKHYMPSVRLTQEYLLNMSEGHGRSRSVLGEYRYALEGAGSKPQWMYRLRFRFRLFLRVLKFRILKRALKSSASLAQCVSHATNRGSFTNDVELLFTEESSVVANRLWQTFERLRPLKQQNRSCSDSTNL